MRTPKRLFAIVVAACLAAGTVAADEAAPVGPARIVSMNLCADELVLRLADREQIAAVTWFARDPRGSTVAAEAAGVPLTRGLSEEIVALKPDLVIAGAFTTRTTVGLLKRIGFPLLELGVPSDFEGVRAQIRDVASAVGHPGRGEAMIAELDARLAAAASRRGPALRALVMRPNAFTVAPGSLGDAVIRAAGLVNVAAEIGRDRSGQVPLEAAAFADADLIVLDADETRTPSLADTVLHHPVLDAFRREGRTVSIPNRLWSCPGPQVAEVVERLAAAAREARQILSPLRERGAYSHIPPVDEALSEPRRSPPPCGEEVGGGGRADGTAAVDPAPPPPPDPSPQGGGEPRSSSKRPVSGEQVSEPAIPQRAGRIHRLGVVR